MALTKKQLEQITKIINDRILSFMHESLGPRVLSHIEIKQLRDAGLLRGGVRNLIADPNKIGRILSLIPVEARAGLTMKQAEKFVKKLLPQTEVEKRSIEYAQDHAGEYIRGLKDSMIKDARTVITGEALQAVRESVTQAVVERETSSQLKTRLFDKFDDRARDWRRVAFTEMNNAIQHGIGSEIKRNSDDREGQMVFKRPNPDACPHCVKLYLHSDQITPKIFKLSELADNNVGLKPNSWQPTLGSVHPWCSCQLQVIPDGYGFVTKYVVSEKIEHGGKTFLAGQEISEDIRSGLSVEGKNKTRKEAILTFTGE